MCGFHVDNPIFILIRQTSMGNLPYYGYLGGSDVGGFSEPRNEQLLSLLF